MVPSIDALEAYADAVAPLLGLAVAPEHRADLIENLGRLFVQARIVMAFPLPEEIEAATIFRA